MKKFAVVLFLSAACGVSEVEVAATEPRALELAGPLNDAFRAAEAETGVPRELLMAIAYQQGRFERAQPPLERPLAASTDPEEQGEEHVFAHRFGVMYLDEAQRAGTDPDDDAANILAAARLLQTAGASGLGDYEPALRAFQNLADAPAAAQLAVDDIAKILRRGFDVTTPGGERLAVLGYGEPEPQAAAQGLGEYPPTQWIPAASSNQSSRNGTPIRFVVIHDMEGFLPGAIAVFQNPARQASAHYCLRSSDGHIVQMVSEANNAWHSGNGWYNRSSIGIEHEGFAGRVNGGGFYTETQYAASARLVCAITRRYGLPIDRGHIFGHGNVPVSGSGALCSDADANAARCGGSTHHWDPGPYWNWGHFLDLIARACGAGGGGGSAGGGFGRIGANADGRLELFVRGGDDAVHHQWQLPEGGWSGWSSLGGAVTSDPVVASNADGRLELFVLGTDRAVHHRWQGSPNGGWSDWARLGGEALSEPAVGRNADGRLEVFVRGTDQALWHAWQTTPSGGWSGWSSLGGIITEPPAVGRDASGRLRVFVRGGDGAVHSIAQVAANSGWGPWRAHGGVITGAPAVGTNADGRLEVFVRGSDDQLWHQWEGSPGGGDFGGFAPRGGVLRSRPSVVSNGDGRLEVFVTGSDDALWHIWQKEPNGGWGDFVSLGGVLTAGPHAARNADGRLEVFVRGAGGAVHHKWQLAPSWGFSDWGFLGGFVTSF